MPYLTVGYIVWGFMSATVNDSCIAFIDSSRIIKQIKLPYSVYVLRMVWRNFIIFLHTIVIYIPVAIVFKVEPNLTMLYAHTRPYPGLREPDLADDGHRHPEHALSRHPADRRHRLPARHVRNPDHVAVSSLGDAKIVAELNPVYHLIEITRAPLLGDGSGTAFVARRDQPWRLSARCSRSR